MLTMKDIIREGNPLLRMKTNEVVLPLSLEDEKTLLAMSEYIFNSIQDDVAKKYNLRPAVGIAAPQIGILKKMIVIFAGDEHGKNHYFPVINPVITYRSKDLCYLPGGEGCLSVDRVVEGYIHRSKKIVVEAYAFQNSKLKKVTLRLQGYLAIVFQHEYDHLDGILFVDHVNKENPFFVPENSTPIHFDWEDEVKENKEEDSPTEQKK